MQINAWRGGTEFVSFIFQFKTLARLLSSVRGIAMADFFDIRIFLHVYVACDVCSLFAKQRRAVFLAIAYKNVNTKILYISNKYE